MSTWHANRTEAVGMTENTTPESHRRLLRRVTPGEKAVKGLKFSNFQYPPSLVVWTMNRPKLFAQLVNLIQNLRHIVGERTGRVPEVKRESIVVIPIEQVGWSVPFQKLEGFPFVILQPHSPLMFIRTGAEGFAVHPVAEMQPNVRLEAVTEFAE
jgi:hypothetical protein